MTKLRLMARPKPVPPKDRVMEPSFDTLGHGGQIRGAQAGRMHPRAVREPDARPRDRAAGELIAACGKGPVDHLGLLQALGHPYSFVREHAAEALATLLDDPAIWDHLSGL
jgi:hypothetical protein